MLKKTITHYLPPLLWALFIFNLSSIPHLEVTSEPLWNFITRKLAHLVMFGILAILIYRALGKKNPLHAVILTTLYAATDEFHQEFVPSRTGKFSDIIIDLIGALAGVYLFITIFKEKPKRGSKKSQRSSF